MGLDNLGSVVGAMGCMLVAGALAVASFVDLHARIIPNACPLLIAALWAPASFFGAAPTVEEGLAGACGLAGFLLACDVVARRLWGAGGVGGGDVKLAAALGLWTGLMTGLAMMALACAFALVARCAIVAARRSVAGFARAEKPVAAAGPDATSGARAEPVGPRGGLVEGGGMPMAPSISLGFLAALLLRLGGWG